MLAENLAVCIDDIARPDIFLVEQDGVIVAFDKVLAFGLFCQVFKPGFRGESLDFMLGKFTERKNDAGKLGGGEPRKKIGLVLGVVDCPTQKLSAFGNPRVVARGENVKIEQLVGAVD